MRQGMTSNSSRNVLRLSLVSGVGPKVGRQLIDAFGNIDSLWRAVDEGHDIRHQGISDKLAKALKASTYGQCDQILDHCTKQGVSVITLADTSYPERLAQLDDSPLLLFAIGDVEQLSSERMLAVVGARKALQDDKWIARKWSRSLASAGVCVVSGMAYGIDAAAHRGVLDVSKPTIAVLGCGLSTVNALQLRQIQAITDVGGVVISEFLPLDTARAEYFPRRNRVIAGISDATLVIAAAKRSGSLITANLAAGYGRDVMAVPGSILNDAHEGCHHLIQDGAVLVSSTEEVLSHMKWEHMKWESKPEEVPGQGDSLECSSQEAVVIQALQQGVMHLDAISEISQMSVSELSSVLLALELRGIISRLPGSRYALAD